MEKLDLNIIDDTIRKRYSCRTYSGKAPDKEALDSLKDLVQNRKVGPMGSSLRFLQVNLEEGDTDSLKGLGTYGTIKNQTGFILGAVEAGPFDMEDFGYVMEEWILFAAQLEIDTCWLGGTFNRSNFAERIQLTSGESQPCVTSLGKAANKKNLVDRILHHRAGSIQRIAWENLFFDQDFSQPLDKMAAGDYAAALEMVRLAPSASNKQPWRILREENNWHFYLQRTPNYPPPALKLADLQRVDIGIAMCHFDLYARSQKLKGDWQEKTPELKVLPENTEYRVSWVSA